MLRVRRQFGFELSGGSVEPTLVGLAERAGQREPELGGYDRRALLPGHRDEGDVALGTEGKAGTHPANADEPAAPGFDFDRARPPPRRTEAAILGGGGGGAVHPPGPQ